MAKLVHDIQKKQHRERSQVAGRTRLGFLEKHKDYVKRAQDYHKKQNALKVLRSKAKDRNPDEYYHAMNSRKVDNKGLLIKSRYADDEDPSLTMDQVKLLKTQDSNYIRTLRQNELNKLKRKTQEVGFKAQSQHTVFVDDQEAMREFKPEDYFNTTKEFLNRRENRLTKDQLTSQELNVADPDTLLMPKESLDKKRLKKIKLVQQHKEREQQLREIQQRMDNQRERMKKGSKKKITDSKGNVAFKWKKQRKR
ncbi:hypothetical protein RNJ44_02639 [Nakaseomyces bracarensis]|uniref:U3 small nucleolar RNA-associated protein 11 n=1 Tax=Nakaseomyces bracarensis TaxID=273131 RepID=A0ABR4NZV0_9SACH